MTEKENAFTPSVLILTDRLQLPVKELVEYLRKNTAIRIRGVESESEGVLHVARENQIDFLIIAGFLRNEKTYEVLYELDEIQNNYLEVHWAAISPTIFDHKQTYHIRANFDRFRPCEEFVGFLEKMYRDVLSNSETKYVRPPVKTYTFDRESKPPPPKTAWQKFTGWFNSK